MLLDDEETGVLALRPRVRLQRHGVVARDRAQPALEVADQAEVAVRLVELDVPAGMIRFVHDSPTDRQKAACLFRLNR